MLDTLFELDLEAMFTPSVSLLEVVVRGTVVYLALFCLLRFVTRREAGALAITDLLVVVLIADAAQNALAADYTSIVDGLLLVSVIAFWAFALDWLGFRLPLVQRFLRPRKLLLIRDGRLIRKNMAKEQITEGELLTQLRLRGLTRPEDVSEAYLESDGRVSVIQHAGSVRPSSEEPERPTIR